MRRLLLILAVAAASSGLTVAVLALQARADEEPEAPTLRESMEELRECLRDRGLDRARRMGPPAADAEALREALHECGAPLRAHALRSLPEMAELRDAYLADVAQRLEVTVEELRAALKDAALAQVDRLVEEGEISEEKAERLKERIEAGAPLFLGPGPGPR